MGNAHDVARHEHAGRRVECARGRKFLRGLALVGGSIAASWIGLSIANGSTASALPQIGSGTAPGNVVVQQIDPQSNATPRQGGIPLLGKGIGNLIGAALPSLPTANPAPVATVNPPAAQADSHATVSDSPAAQGNQESEVRLATASNNNPVTVHQPATEANSPGTQAKSSTSKSEATADAAAPISVLDAVAKPLLNALSTSDSPAPQANPSNTAVAASNVQIDVQTEAADGESADVPRESAPSEPAETVSVAASGVAPSGSAVEDSAATQDQQPTAGADQAAGESLDGLPVVGWLTDKNDPIGQLTAPLLKPVTDATAPVTAPVMNAAASLVKPVDDVTDKLTAPVRESLRPVSDAVEPVTTTVAKTVEPVTDVVAKTVVEPVAKAAAPVVATVADVAVKPVADVAAPVVSTVAEAVVEPVADIVTPTVTQLTQSVVEPVTTTAQPVVETVTKPVNDTVAPLTATVSGAVLEPVVETVEPVTSTVTEPVGGTITPITSQISTTLGTGPTIGSAGGDDSVPGVTIATSTTYRPGATFTMGLPEPVATPVTTTVIEPTGELGSDPLVLEPLPTGGFIGGTTGGIIGGIAPGGTSVAPVDLGSYAQPDSLVGSLLGANDEAGSTDSPRPADSVVPSRGPNPITPQTPVPAPAAPSGPGGPGGVAGGSSSMSGGASSGASAPAACLADRWNLGLASFGVLGRDGERSLKCDARKPPTSPA